MWFTKIETLLQSHTISAVCWLILTAIVLYVDFITGPAISFPVFVVLPVALAAWYNGKAFSMFLSILSVAVSGLLFHYLWFKEFDVIENGTNAFIQLSVFILIAFLIDRISRMTMELKKEIKVLEGFLPVCSFCKKIRDKDNNWHQMEEYISDHSQARFSHGVCPDCARKHYGFTDKKK
ncbi:MAG: hypothetical protein CVV44_16565 [Spirochaetae bacterium HGW-Spirochaetae-1]|jgi:K+-sensing histidine kinase KdpD|nr:MAG: hypothetical protein CVV44_16565 [Spirochaetae bacterium HGW-Spirochaetae-1]